MIICEQCFIDENIQNHIRDAGKQGTCSVCQSKDVYICDTEQDLELREMFENFISIYKPHSSFESTELTNSSLAAEIMNNWEIFNRNFSEDTISLIIQNLCKDLNVSDLLANPVVISVQCDSEYMSQHSLLIDTSWDDFAKKLKRENHFHTHCFNFELLERFFSYCKKTYKKECKFYRARISSEKGFSPAEMGAPPMEKAIAGRVNAKGVKCLYLGESEKTVIHEVRAGLHDYVSVGEFELKCDIAVLNLRGIDKLSPFFTDLDCQEYAVNKMCLQRINREMSRVMRRTDSSLDYLPTQYIADFVKTIGLGGGSPVYSGIEYGSTMNINGFNLAIFDPGLLVCTEVSTHEIGGIEYSTIPVKSEEK